jgi:hypothetical protein
VYLELQRKNIFALVIIIGSMSREVVSVGVCFDCLIACQSQRPAVCCICVGQEYGVMEPNIIHCHSCSMKLLI